MIYCPRHANSPAPFHCQSCKRPVDLHIVVRDPSNWLWVATNVQCDSCFNQKAT